MVLILYTIFKVCKVVYELYVYIGYYDEYSFVLGLTLNYFSETT
jgi:hypothetical protein